GHDKAPLGVHLGSQGPEALQVLVDGTGAAEVAAAGEGHIRQAEPAQQSPQHVVGRPAAAGGLVGNPAVAELGGVDLHGVEVDITHIRAQILQNPQQQLHVADLGNVFDPAGAAHHESGGNDGNGGVFRAADMDFTKQGT